MEVPTEDSDPMKGAGYLVARQLAGVRFAVPEGFRADLLYCPARGPRPQSDDFNPIVYRLSVDARHKSLLRRDRVMDTARAFRPRAVMWDGWKTPTCIFDGSDEEMSIRHLPDWHYYGVSHFALYLPDTVVEEGNTDDDGDDPVPSAQDASPPNEVRADRGAVTFGACPPELVRSLLEGIRL